MKTIKVAAAVLNQTPLAWNANRDNILDAIEQAKAEGVQFLCLPELCVTGYGCEDAFHSPGLLTMAWRVVQEILPTTRGIVTCLGLPVLHNNALFNAACVICDGKVLGFVAKQHLAGDGLHYEPRWFKPWPSGRHDTLKIGNETYPIGDLYFDCGGVKFGFEICEDAWVAKRPGAALSQLGVDIIMNPSASHFAFDKTHVRRRFVVEGSRAFGVTYLYANLLGNEAGRAIYDGGALIASGGRLITAGPRFSYTSFVVTSAVVDVQATRMTQARTASYVPSFDGDGPTCVRGAIDLDAAEFGPPTPIAPAPAAAWEESDNLKEEEFTRATCLALLDYLTKSRSSGFVVSLSGGADSSAVACLCALALHLATKELGEDALRARLRGSADVQDRLTCVYQSTRNSSERTLSAARLVADALGATFMHIDVDDLVERYVAKVSDALGRPLEWATDDVALQNIQARARAPGVWMIANVKNALLLATSNRSEAAVGYATMDGDTCGGVSPIAGIDKAFLLQWLRWLEVAGPHGRSIPALSVVNALVPTAELRPEADHQTDETDLMPYPVLEAIEDAAIRDKLTPEESFEVTRRQFPDIPEATMLVYIERFYRLWCRNQWKRERYAPSFHVDDKNVDPKTWCRFPILSGGFSRELRELAERRPAD